MIKKYISKPYPVHAVQWDGANEVEIDRILKGTNYVFSVTRGGNVATLIISKGPTVHVLRAVLGTVLVRHNDMKLDILTEAEFNERYEEEGKVKPK